MKDNRGEISIQMIITVIVLIILGGICIFMLTGDNGLFVPREDGNQVITENSTNNQNAVNDVNQANTAQ